MATTEELLARIAELEAENAALRQEKSGKPFLPKDLREKYPWAKYVGDAGKLFCDPISKSIRGMCFPMSTKERQFHNQHTGRSYKSEASYIIRFINMSCGVTTHESIPDFPWVLLLRCNTALSERRRSGKALFPRYAVGRCSRFCF